jgi:hypothetical protein
MSFGRELEFPVVSHNDLFNLRLPDLEPEKYQGSSERRLTLANGDHSQPWLVEEESSA